MNIKTTYPDDVLESIAIREKAILAIQTSYLKELDLLSATGIQRAERIIKNMKTDLRIKRLEKEILDIYTSAVPKIIVTAETADEREFLNRGLGYNGPD